MSKALTWDELAALYDKDHKGSRPARTLPMDQVYNWAANQPRKFRVDPKEGTLHLIEKETK